MIFEITPVAGLYIGLLKIVGVSGGYYAISKDRMKVVTKLLTYAKLDGLIK